MSQTRCRLTLNAFSIFWSFCLVYDLCPDALFPLRPSLAAALSDSQSNSLLNGNFVVAMFKREINFKGTIIEYSGSDTKVERINCTERIEEELILQVQEEPFGLLCSAVIYFLLLYVYMSLCCLLHTSLECICNRMF